MVSNRSTTPNTVKNASSTSCTYGTHYPSRIFAGHLPGKVTASDLADFFRAYGTVLEGKIVLDSLGHSRRFGFVTFATPEDVRNVLSQESIVFNGKKINVGPAVKKMNSDDEMTPPQSPNPNILEKLSKISSIPSNGESSFERIVTVPPVNETTDSNTDAKRSGNVWLKINSETNSNKNATTMRRQQDIRNPMHPIAYPTYNIHPVPYPASFTAPTTQQGLYLHNQAPINQPLVRLMPYQQPHHHQQHFLQPVPFNVARQIVF